MKIKDKEKNLEIFKKQMAFSNTTSENKAIKLLFIIVESGYAKEITELLFAAEVHFNLLFMGTGTANSHLLNVLGLGTSSRDVILATITNSKVQAVIELIYNVCHLAGIVFTVKLKSIGNRNVLKLIQGE